MDFSQLSPVALALAIFLARIVDVSMGTLRTIFVFRGYPFIAAALGFFEILLWLAAAAQVFQNLDAWYLAVAYAGGFAAGNIVGMWLESKLAIGSELVRVVSTNPQLQLGDHLRDFGYEITELAGRGEGGNSVEVLLVVEKRKKVRKLMERIRAVDPEAFWTINDVRRRPAATSATRRGVLARPEWIRVGKKR